MVFKVQVVVVDLPVEVLAVDRESSHIVLAIRVDVFVELVDVTPKLSSTGI